MECLFQEEMTQCKGVTSEHLLQQCIGGTWEADDVICADCNSYFSKEIDNSLCTNFEVLMCVLSPFLSGRLKHKKLKFDSAEGIPLQMTAGGLVGLSKTKTKRERNDIRIYSHSDTEALAAAQSQKLLHEGFEIKRLPVSELIKLPRRLNIFDGNFQRAVMKCIIEIFDKSARQDLNMNYARRPELKSIRKFIRHGVVGGPVLWNYLPIFRLENEMQLLFPENLQFSNRVAIFFDNKRGKLFGLLQIANTIPLGGYLSTGLDWAENSFSYLYEKNLIQNQGGKPTEKWLPFCAMDERKFSSRQFTISSKHSADFAWHSFGQSLNERIGWAYAYLAMHSDEILLKNLNVYFEHLKNNQALSSMEALISSVENSLRLNYQSQVIPESRWANVRDEVRAVLQANLSLLCETFTEVKIFGEAAPTLIAVYRSQLSNLLDEFGPPVNAVPSGM